MIQFSFSIHMRVRFIFSNKSLPFAWMSKERDAGDSCKVPRTRYGREHRGCSYRGKKFLRPQWYCYQSTFFVFSIPKREAMEGGMISLSTRIYPAHLKSSNNWVHSLSIKAIVRWCVSNKKILIPPLWAPNHSYLQVMKPPSTGERLQDLSFEICLVPPNDSDNKEKT